MARRKTTVAASIACGVLCAACVVAFMQGVRGEAEAARAVLEAHGLRVLR